MKRDHLSLIVFILLFCAFPFLVGVKSYWITVFIFAGIYSLITIGLSLLMGYAGQISLGHAAFFGMGAYTSGLLTTLLNWNPWLALLAALLLTSSAALLIGIPTLRLSGHYLAMATLALGEILVIFFKAEVELTGGPSGFGLIPRLSIFGFVLKRDIEFYFFVWSIVALALVMAMNVIHSRVGRALRSIHGGELAANAMGINTSSYKVQVFVLSAALASLSGSLYAHYVTFVSPTACELKLSVFLVVMVAIGGMHHLWGAIVGTILLTVLPEFLHVFQDFDILAYGLILMIIMIFAPNGLVGALAALIQRLRRRFLAVDSQRRGVI
ncbi:MAG: branched-chain amino acid ABC transporter permease [Candidatus Omnitrophica bacterium]|nr:branched-chain amino acid ABC transporter permease [Candidatus Omnitrophota bacterium]